MARHKVARLQLALDGDLLLAAFHAVGAAGVELTALGWIGGGRDAALQHDPVHLHRGIGHRNGGEQSLGVLVDRDQSVKSAGGYLIQLLPGATEDTIVKVEGGIMAAGPVSALLEQDPDPEHLLRTVMSDFDLKILETQPVSYKCYCSRERVERALISLGRKELEDMLREQGGCQLSCQFCDTVYDFSKEDLEKLLATL